MSNYHVIDTDYDSYSVVYACGLRKSFLWLLSREDTISDQLYEKMLASAKAKLPPVDGLNMVPYLLGKTEESPRKEVCRSQLSG